MLMILMTNITLVYVNDFDDQHLSTYIVLYIIGGYVHVML